MNFLVIFTKNILHERISAVAGIMNTYNLNIMKKYIYFTLLFLTTIACQAQSPVFDIMDVPEGPKGSYYKDKNGLLDGYDGTYVYTNGNSYRSIDRL